MTLEEQAKEPFCEKRSRKTVKEWLESKAQELIKGPEYFSIKNFEIACKNDFINELLLDPFLVEVLSRERKSLESAQKLQELAEKRKEVVYKLEREKHDLEAKLAEANRIIDDADKEEDSEAAGHMQPLINRLRGILK